MSPGRRALLALPLAIASVLFGVVTGSWPVTLGLLLAAGISVATPKRLDWVGAAQVVLAAMLMPAAAGLASLAGDADEGLHPFWYGLSLAGLLIGASRLLLEEPKWGHRGTAVFVLFGVVAAGGTRTGGVYAPTLVLWGLAQVAALRSLEPSRPKLGELRRRPRVGALGLLGVAALVTWGLVTVLPPLHAWGQRQIRDAIRGGRAGFGGGLELGELTDMILSDKVTLRVVGLRGDDHLRGAVYTRYRDGRWFERRGDKAQLVAPPALPGETAPVRVERVSGEASRHFAPLAGQTFAVPSDQKLYADSAGILRTAPGVEAAWLDYVTGERAVAGSAAPRAEDVQVPADVREPLTQIAREWTAGVEGDAARLAAIERRFSADFEYALTFERTPGRDPVIDFLTRNRLGHCEYFASATALLARSLDIPARVVGGYLVTEHNPVGGYHIVREANAHAWVEAWVDGSWRTVDTTPASGTADHMGRETSWLSGAVDATRAALGRAWDYLVADGAWRLLSAAAVLGVLFVVLVAIRRRRERLARTRIADHLAFDGPLECLAGLESALVSHDLVRAPQEPLAAFADRVRARLPDRALGAATGDLLERYVALRFGQVGDEEALVRDVTALVRTLTLDSAPPDDDTAPALPQ